MRHFQVGRREDLLKAEVAQVHQELQFCRSSYKDQVCHQATSKLCKICINQSSFLYLENGGSHNCVRGS